MFLTFNHTNTISGIDELKSRPDLTYFEIDYADKPGSSELQELCIEIASHTPDAQAGDNKDKKNEGRLNPFVGAILVKEESGAYKVYGACRSALHKGIHGECGLLTHILGGLIVKDCEMYVTLEPCTQESRHEWTEPCCEIIRNRGIRKVTVGILDPNPDVAGHGIDYLLKAGIEIKFFDIHNRKRLLEMNRDFIDQFKDESDPRLNRKIARIINSYISDDAIRVFVQNSEATFGVHYDAAFWENCKHAFYRKMIENRSIIDGQSKLLPFDVIKEFALFFYKEPYHMIDGATIKYRFDYGNDTDETDLEEISYNGPYIFAFDTYSDDPECSYSILGQIGFIEAIGKRYGFAIGDSLKSMHDAGLQVINDRFGKDGLKVVREAFINAIMHRDYECNQSFTTITLSAETIEIVNPISRKMGKLKALTQKFNAKKVSSFPVNPKLMRYFMLYSQAERNGSGLSTLLKRDNVALLLDDNYLLTTRISLK